MTSSQKRYIESHLRYLTDREKEYYRAMLPVWCEDIKRVMCPEELVTVIEIRMEKDEERKRDTIQPRRRKGGSP